MTLTIFPPPTPIGQDLSRFCKTSEAIYCQLLQDRIDVSSQLASALKEEADSHCIPGTSEKYNISLLKQMSLDLAIKMECTATQVAHVACDDTKQGVDNFSVDPNQQAEPIVVHAQDMVWARESARLQTAVEALKKAPHFKEKVGEFLAECNPTLIPLRIMMQYVGSLSCLMQRHCPAEMSERSDEVQQFYLLVNHIRDQVSRKCSEEDTQSRFILTALMYGYTELDVQEFRNKYVHLNTDAKEKKLLVMLEKKEARLFAVAYDLEYLDCLVSTGQAIDLWLEKMRSRQGLHNGEESAQEYPDIPNGETLDTLIAKLSDMQRDNENLLFYLVEQGLNKVWYPPRGALFDFSPVNQYSFVVCQYNWLSFMVIIFLAKFDWGRRMCKAAALYAKQNEILNTTVLPWMEHALNLITYSNAWSRGRRVTAHVHPPLAPPRPW